MLDSAEIEEGFARYRKQYSMYDVEQLEAFFINKITQGVVQGDSREGKARCDQDCHESRLEGFEQIENETSNAVTGVEGTNNPQNILGQEASAEFFKENPSKTAKTLHAQEIQKFLSQVQQVQGEASRTEWQRKGGQQQDSNTKGPFSIRQSVSSLCKLPISVTSTVLGTLLFYLPQIESQL
jgi:hypothetical protein